MRLNKDIIYHNLNEYLEAKCDGQEGSSKLLLERPEFYLDKSGFFLENHVYVCSADHLPSLPSIEKNVLLVCLGVSPQLSIYKRQCTVILVDDSENIFVIFNILQQIFNKYEAWENQLNRILRESSSLQEILDHSKSIFNNPMLLIGSDFKYIARTEDKYLREEMQIDLESSTFDSSKLATFLSMHDMSTHVKEPFVLTLLGKRSLATNIFDIEEYMGCLIVFEEFREFHSSDLALCHFLYKYLRQAILNNPILSSERSALRKAVREVIIGKPIDFEFRRVLDYANNKQEYICAYLQPELFSSHLPSGYLPSLIEDRFPEALSFEHVGSVVALIPSKLIDSNSSELADAISALKYRAGVSQAFSNLYESNHYFYQATSAMKNGLIYYDDRTIFYYNDYIISELLFNAACAKPAHIYFSDGLRSLIEYDRTSQVSYIETLKVYLDNNMAVTKTAQDLFVHRSTLLERLCHINKYLGDELTDPERRLAIRIALGINDMYERFK